LIRPKNLICFGRPASSGLIIIRMERFIDHAIGLDTKDKTGKAVKLYIHRF
jgi:hypothetical protein